MSESGGKTYRRWEPERYRHEAQSPAAKLPEGDLVFFLLDTVPQLPGFRAMKEDSYWDYECSKVHSYKGYIPSQRVKERQGPLAERRAPCTSL